MSARYPGRTARRIAWLLLVLAVAGTPARAWAQNLEPLVRIGPWPGVSSLIGYGERLWFVNSVKFVNHNSADLYSYDPQSGSARFERHLFSQDAGDPVVLHGLLYWPFEDSRFSAGRGEFMVTDGSTWAWRALPEGQVFHLHAMAVVGDSLFAATSAWRAGLQRSDDGGATWRVLYDHPTEKGYVSRITSLAVLEGELYAGMTAWAQDGIKLLRHRDGRTEPVAAWPEGRSTRELTAWRGWLYAWNADDTAGALWRTDGKSVERVATFDGQELRALASGGDALYAATAAGAGGTLWRSEDGRSWRLVQEFADLSPLDLALYGGRLYLGALGADGRGVLLGPPPPAPREAAPEPGPLPRAPAAALAAVERDARLADLARLLGSADSYARRADPLRDEVEPLAMSGDPAVGAALAGRLAGPYPSGRIKLFGGNLSVPMAWVGRWLVLRAAALAGGGRVPLEFLREPFASSRNRAEKYFDIQPAAAFAVAVLGQDDDATLETLIEALDGGPGQPRWVIGDLIGALSALTGERLGYDVAAWRAWWRKRMAR